VTWYRFIAEDGSRVQILRPVTEDEVLECFVLAERDSPRYGERVRALLEQHHGDVRAVLADYRSYGRGDNVFSGFPEDVSWYRARLSSWRNPPLIAVRAPGSYLVLLEGHVRLTAYAAFPEHVPDELEIFLGESPRMDGWALY
jgi:hypothetical protein